MFSFPEEEMKNLEFSPLHTLSVPSGRLEIISVQSVGLIWGAREQSIKRAIGSLFSLPAGCQGLDRNTEFFSVSPSFEKTQSWKTKPNSSLSKVEGAATKPGPLDTISQPWNKAEPEPKMKSMEPLMVQSSKKEAPESK